MSILTPRAHRKMVRAITVIGRQPSRREIRQAYRRYLWRLAAGIVQAAR